MRYSWVIPAINALYIVTADVFKVLAVFLVVVDFKACTCDVVAAALYVTPIDIICDVVVCWCHSACYVEVVGLLSFHCLVVLVVVDSFFLLRGFVVPLSHYKGKALFLPDQILE